MGLDLKYGVTMNHQRFLMREHKGPKLFLIQTFIFNEQNGLQENETESVIN